jgi:uncharacterized protein
MTLPLLDPSLYGLDARGQPVLLGGRCACGHKFFPMQTTACERCGRSGDALTAHELATRGRLLATATVYTQADARRSPKFVIGAVELDDGPVVRTLLDEAPDEIISAVRCNRRVRAVLVPIKDEDREALDVRFRIDAAS